jgi:tetratricopeptide (TPR) repeat protein
MNEFERDRLLEAGLSGLQTGDADGAREAILAILSEREDDVVAWANLAAAYRMLGQRTDQLRAARKAYILGKGDDSARLVLATALVENGRPRQALAITTCSSASTVLHQVRGSALRDCGDLQGAIREFRAAVRVSRIPDSFSMFEIGQCLLREGRPQEARASFGGIIRLGERTALPPLPRGADPVALAWLGVAAADLAIAMESRLPSGFESAARSYLVAHGRIPNDPYPLAKACQAYRLAGKHEVSLHYGDLAVSADSGDFSAAYQRALTLIELGRGMEAVDALKTLLDGTGPGSGMRPDILIHLSFAAGVAGQEDLLQEVAAMAAESGVDSVMIRNAKAMAMLRRGDLEGAVAEWRAALAIDESDAVTELNLGHALLRQGDYASAKKATEAAASRWRKCPPEEGVRIIARHCLFAFHVEGPDAANALTTQYRQQIEDIGDPSLVEMFRMEVNALAEEVQRAEASGPSGIISALESSVTRFEDLLAASEREEELKQFLKQPENRLILGLDAEELRTEVRLGNEHRVDIVLRMPSGRYELVELEQAGHALFTGKGASAQLTHGRQQVEDWLAWCEINHAYAENLLPGIQDPAGMLVIGRSGPLTERQRERLRAMNAELRRIRVMTYDELLARAKTLLGNLKAIERNA